MSSHDVAREMKFGEFEVEDETFATVTAQCASFVYMRQGGGQMTLTREGALCLANKLTAALTRPHPDNPARDEALKAAAERFREYERSHMAASTVDGIAPQTMAEFRSQRIAKAARNREMAELCEAALALSPAIPREEVIEEADLPWCDLKVAFDVDDAGRVLEADIDLPDGWELMETNCSGTRCVAIFRVDGLPSARDGEKIAAAIRSLASQGGEGK